MVEAPFTAKVGHGPYSRFLTGLGKSVGRLPGFTRLHRFRIQMAMIFEAIRILEEGTASATDIDNAVRMSFGPPSGHHGPLGDGRSPPAWTST